MNALSRGWRWTVAICALATSALWGCQEAICAVEEQFNDCSPTSSASYAPCGGSWHCDSIIAPTQTYEVRCEDRADVGMVCGCWRNGSFEREIPRPIWCSPNVHIDSYERIPDANFLCGWSMSTCRV